MLNHQSFLSLSFLICTSFVFCVLLTPLVRNLAVRLGWVDVPDFVRKMHRVPVPRIGGVPVVLALGVAFTALSLAHFKVPMVTESLAIARSWLPGVALIAVVGLLDDLIGLKPMEKLPVEIFAAALVCLDGLNFRLIAGHELEAIFRIAVTLFWIVGCTNAWNLIDGVDGLAAGLGLVATLTMLLAGLLGGHPELMLLAAPLAGSLLGFLCFNFNPASIFLGDSGSLSIGFLLGCFGAALSQHAGTLPGMIAPAVALSIPLLDVALSISRRFLSAKPIFTADHGHIHHRLIDRGLTPRSICLSLCGVSAAASCFALVLGLSSELVGDVALLGYCAAVSISIQCLRYREFGIFAGLLRGLRVNVRSQLLLHTYEMRLQEAAGSPEECWSVLRKAKSELGFASITLQLRGYHFEELASTNGHGTWKLSVPFSGADYVSLTAQTGSLITEHNVIRLADLLQRTLTEQPVSFPAVVKKDRGGVIPASDGWQVNSSRAG